MATLSRGQTFGSTETISNTKLHNLVDLGSVSNIVDADCSPSMNLADTKLADITTGNKVRGTALGNLASIPSGAGLIPFANIGNLGLSIASIPNLSIAPITRASWVDGAAMRNIQSMPSLAGQLAWYSMVQSLASGGLPVFNGQTSFVGKNIQEIAKSLSNVIYCWTGMVNSDASASFNANSSLIVPAGKTYMYLYASGGTTYKELLASKWIKISGVSTLTVYCQIWQANTNTVTCKVDVGGQSGSVDGTASQTTPEWKTFTIDVTSLSNGTVYDLSVQLKQNNANGQFLMLGAIVIFGS